ncbi:MAG: sugar transferase [Verrucomicrobia bacterium]|nr:sugar transferase [Verrucomicrobiota bacterium]
MAWNVCGRFPDDLRCPTLAAKPVGQPGSPKKTVKRIFDFVFSLAGLFILGPLLLVIAASVTLYDGGPAFFRQRRIGFQGRPFQILKFRTMILEAESRGPGVTKDGDPRVTGIGRFLRKSKMDELPQLLNVLKGEMSFVGPRPELPKYVDLYSPEQRQVLELKPGITDLATLAFRNEEMLLKSASNVENFYLNYCVPQKILLNLEYARRANLWEDLKIIFRTLLPNRSS